MNSEPFQAIQIVTCMSWWSFLRNKTGEGMDNFQNPEHFTSRCWYKSLKSEGFREGDNYALLTADIPEGWSRTI